MLSKQLRLYAGKKETVHITTIAVLITDLVKALRQTVFFYKPNSTQGNTLKSYYVMVPIPPPKLDKIATKTGFADIYIFDEGMKFQKKPRFCLFSVTNLSVP